MILRHFIFFILLVVLPDFYIDYNFLRQRQDMPAWKRLLWWTPSFLMVAFTCFMASQEDFIPRNYVLLEIYIGLLGVLVIPKVLFSICSLVGWVITRCRRQLSSNGRHSGAASLSKQANIELNHEGKARTFHLAEHVGVTVAAMGTLAFTYGFTLGFNQVEVEHKDLYFSDLPQAFDGYRIVQVSDLHAGTYTGWRRGVLHILADSIQAQHPDLICFTGDLQNIRPEEVMEVKQELSQWGDVVSVMGNHDYGEYIGGDDKARQQVEQRMKEVQRRQLDWVLLDNANVSITDSTGSSRIYIAGTGNDGRAPFPNKADYKKALQGIPEGAFVIMLQHDPSAWKRNILPQTKAQLTLSGHTHGGQFSFFGWRPTQLVHGEDYGDYEEDERSLVVSGGVGGVVPFRLGIPGSIIVITLHRKSHNPHL